MKESNVLLEDAVRTYFPNTTELQLSYPSNARKLSTVFPNIKVLRLSRLGSDPDTFHRFMAHFPNVERIYIETVHRLSTNLWNFLEPFQHKIRGLPADTFTAATPDHIAFRDLDNLYVSTRFLTDWRIRQSDLVHRQVFCENLRFLLRHKQDFEAYYPSYLQRHKELNLELQEPFEVPHRIHSLKLHIRDAKLVDYKSLANCDDFELCAFVSGDSESQCFWGHETVPNRIKRLTIRLGSKKRCAQCWQFMIASLDIEYLHVHAIPQPFMFTLLAQLPNLRYLALQMSPIPDDEGALEFTWHPLPLLRTLKISFKNELSCKQLAQILDAQQALVCLDLRGSGNFHGIINCLTKMQKLRFLTFFLNENLFDLQDLSKCKMLKVKLGNYVFHLYFIQIKNKNSSLRSQVINFDETVTDEYEGEPYDPKIVFFGCPLLQQLNYSYRQCATRMWRRSTVDK